MQEPNNTKRQTPPPKKRNSKQTNILGKGEVRWPISKTKGPKQKSSPKRTTTPTNQQLITTAQNKLTHASVCHYVCNPNAIEKERTYMTEKTCKDHIWPVHVHELGSALFLAPVQHNCREQCSQVYVQCMPFGRLSVGGGLRGPLIDSPALWCK